ncbi:MAG: response regulator [Dehalococcoidia bacterium]
MAKRATSGSAPRKRAGPAGQQRRTLELITAPLAVLSDAVVVLDTDGRVVSMNAAAQTLSGWFQQEVCGKPIRKIIDSGAATSEPEAFPFAGLVQTDCPDAQPGEAVLIGRHGERRPIALAAAPVHDPEGAVAGFLLACWDLKHEGQPEEELRRLMARLLEVQEEERRQVAYDTHDGLGQLMTAASMHLEAFLGQQNHEQSPDLEPHLARARRCLEEAIVEMRRMVSDLGPLLLEEMGLVEASRRLLSDTAERAGWAVELVDETNSDRLEPAVEITLFRIVQEALANSAKHADARKVRVTFKRDEGLMSVEVRDWGKGFHKEELKRRRLQGRPVGLLGMRERASLVGGSVRIESTPGQGTRIVASVPAARGLKTTNGTKKVEVAKMESRKNHEPRGESIRVLVVDDHPMVREGLRSMLAGDVIEVVGEAATGSQAVDLAQQLLPDVVLMDVRMPDMDGLAATEIIKEMVPGASVVVLTSYESKDYLKRAIGAGAAGYVLKGMGRDRLMDVIRLVREGGSLIDARLLGELLNEMGVEGSRFQGVEGTLETLTQREHEVLRLLVGGLTNKEIAAQMQYSVGTVKNVVQRVIEKLGVSDRTQAAVYAVRAGLNPQPRA